MVNTRYVYCFCLQNTPRLKKKWVFIYSYYFFFLMFKSTANL